MLLIIAAWLFACAMISLMGGWHRLAEKFRATSEIHAEQIRFASMAIGTGLFPAHSRRVLFVTVGPGQEQATRGGYRPIVDGITGLPRAVKRE